MQDREWPRGHRNRDFWGIDGSPRIDDVFIDPQAAEDGPMTCDDREWRTVAIGGYREGGPGYYALDITQPDTLNNVNVPQPTAGYTPSCFDGGGDCDNVPLSVRALGVPGQAAGRGQRRHLRSTSSSTRI